MSDGPEVAISTPEGSDPFAAPVGPDPATQPAPVPGATPLLTAAAVDITASGPPAPAPSAVPLLVAPAAPAKPAPATAAPATATPADAPSHRHGRRARRHWWRWVALFLALVLAAAGFVAAQRINRPLARPVLASSLPAVIPVPGRAPALPWPVIGQGAVSVPALGYLQQSGPESPVPVASLTKMAAAVVVLRDHPLAPGSDGPTITITPADVAEYSYELHNDESNIPIQLGETLSERQMLEALLNQSANDVAYSLALWDAGSEPVFVAKMNALAASLGATSTHYVDASGYNPQSVSTAADSLRIAAAGMSIPAFAQAAGLSTVTLPLVGTVYNIVTEIGSNGVVGVKSGYTSEAGGCEVLAAYRVIGGRSVLVLAAGLGQHVPPPVPPKPSPTTTVAPGSPPPPSTTTTTVPVNDLEIIYPLRYAGPVVEKLLDAAKAALVQMPVVTRGQPLVSATARWDGAPHQVPVVASRGAWLVGWPGQRVASTVKLGPVPAGAAAGSRAGDALYALGQQIQSVPLTFSRSVPEPSWWWRLVHD